jgi:FKBP-type peptidyl-prolyl cis-trans isomerase SlyD
MEKIQPGKYVEMVYDLYAVNHDGTETLVHQVDNDDPEKIVYGVTRGVILPLEQALAGLSVGEKFNVTVSAEEGFGPHDPEQVAHLEKNIFEVEGKFDNEHIVAGAVIPMMTADGYRINGVVLEVSDKEVVMDFNHPLAGKAVRFDGTVKTVREATPADIEPAPGGCSGCGGSCGEGGCGEGCGCN